MGASRALQVACLLLGLLAAADAAVARRGLAARAPPACATKGAATYVVYNEDGFAQRLAKPNTTMVTIRVLMNIPLSGTLLLNASFSCTRFVAAHPNVTTIYNLNASVPTIVVRGASHVLFNGVNVALQTYDNSTQDCLYGRTIQNYQAPLPCPALLLYKSNFIQVTQAQVYGRIDVINTNNSKIDSMTLAANHGLASLVRFSTVGEGKLLVRSNNTVSNTIFNGGPEGYSVGVLLYRGSVGVNIIYNYFFNFTFAAIQCGHDAHNVGDCMLMNINYNYIANGGNAAGDGTGIYFDTHWYNPGNKLQCNYVVGGTHCLYLDWLTTGVVIDGMVCYKTMDGVKVNGGKNNLITGMVIVDLNVPHGAQANPGFINCQNYDKNNCLVDPGNKWVDVWTNRYYGAAPALWRKRYPDLLKICSQTSYNGLSCNPPDGIPANVTGGCSGLAIGNELNFAVVNNVSRIIYPFNDKCIPFDSFLPQMNVIRTVTMSPAAAAFTNYINGDFGLATRRSQLLKKYPGFRSCPRALVGPRRVAKGVAPYMPL